MTRIFMSYGRKDAADFARRLADWLRRQGYDPWLDVENGTPLASATPASNRVERNER